ncbi:MAG: monofunctional biosynthetic peptidoglycan transglycosylase [Elusimicrobia bacterium]|nr:monofunctional biosynthetic peptidoglycan transglycosylase [Elusimicrobiota bacterium]
MASARRLIRGASRALLWGFAAVGMAACATAAYLFWVPDVRHLALENPKKTAYMELFVRSQIRKKKKPIVMMQWTPLRQISPHLQHAVIIAEDDMFYRHKGVDWGSFQKAFDYNLKKGRFARGASTITQQVARNLFLSPSRNPLRKAKEMVIAWKLERALTKDRILELYLNIAEWGVGIYGAQAASRVYFGKDASMLDVEEALALAAALPSPWRLNPPKQTGPGMARKKGILLDRMRRAGYVPAEVSDEDVEVPEGLDLGAAGVAVSSPTPSLAVQP